MKKYVIAAVLATTVWVCLNWAFHELGTAGYIIWAIPAIGLGIFTVKAYNTPAHEIKIGNAYERSLSSDSVLNDSAYMDMPGNIYYTPRD